MNKNNKKRKLSNFNPFFSFEFDRDVTDALINLKGTPIDIEYKDNILIPTFLPENEDTFEDCYSTMVDTLSLKETKIVPPLIESHHLYILIEREFIHSHEQLFKVGKSVHLSQRMSSYPKGSYIISIFKVNDCHKTEKILLKALDNLKTITNARDIGREYYRGNLNDILSVFIDVCMSDHWTI